PVNLLGSVLGVRASDRRQPPPDRVDRQAHGVHDPQDSQRDRVGAPLVDGLDEQLVREALHALGGDANLVAATVSLRIGGRHPTRQRPMRISVIAPPRHFTALRRDRRDQKALALETKYQQVPGTTDEKIPYALLDLEALWIPGCLVYAGQGWSEGVLHTLQGSRRAVHCLASPALARARRRVPRAHRCARRGPTKGCDGGSWRWSSRSSRSSARSARPAAREERRPPRT